MLVEKLYMSMVPSRVSEDPHLDYYLEYLFSRTENRARPENDGIF